MTCVREEPCSRVGPVCRPLRAPVCSCSGAVPWRVQVDQLDLLGEYVDAGNYNRTCLYLTSTSAYLPEPDDQLVLVKVWQWRCVCKIVFVI